MAFSQMSGIKVATGFKLGGKNPLDVRQIMDTINDRDELVTAGACPEGLTVYVKETKKLYVYNGVSWSVVGGSSDVMTGATSESDGTAGLVPAPKKEDANKFLRADGVWALPTVEGGGVGSLVDLGVSASAEELNMLEGAESNIQNQINSINQDKIVVDSEWGSTSTPLPSFE